MELLFREFMFLEGRLEWEATILSRAIMRTIKRDERSMDSLRRGQNVQLYLGDTERYTRVNPIAVNSFLKLDIPDDFPIRNIVIYIIPDKKSYVSGAMVDRTTLAARIRVKQLPDGRPDFGDVYPQMKEILRHELEHSTQSEKSRVGEFEWSDLERAEQYFTDPKEVAAWVSGLYKRAKMTKTPFIVVLNDRLRGWKERMLYREKWARKPPVDPAEVDAVLGRIREKFLDYARRRFFTAQGI